MSDPEQEFYYIKNTYDHTQKYKYYDTFFNKSKNRYNDVIPYNHSRVKLKKLKNNYINANYIIYENIKYISTQAPLKKTFRDFWKMVWDENTTVIVMLTNFIENGKQKSEKYWNSTEKTAYKYEHYEIDGSSSDGSLSDGSSSDGSSSDGSSSDGSSKSSESGENPLSETSESGENPLSETSESGETSESEENSIILEIKLMHKLKLSCYILRVFNLTYIVKKDGNETKTSRDVYHMQYKKWEDHKQPISPEDIFKLIIHMKNLQKTGQYKTNLSGPPIIHCSAGVGRSGTYITCDIIYNQLKQTQLKQTQLKQNQLKQNIKNIVAHIRTYRHGLVQTSKQYLFIHDFLNFLSSQE